MLATRHFTQCKPVHLHKPVLMCSRLQAFAQGSLIELKRPSGIPVCANLSGFAKNAAGSRNVAALA